MQICVVGGGNIGTVLLGWLGRQEGSAVSLLTSRPDVWSHTVDVEDTEKHTTYTGKVQTVTDDPEKILPGADIVFVTLPSNVIARKFCTYAHLLKPGAAVGFIPGTGGVEFYCQSLLEKGCRVFGLQRVPYIARVKEYGKSVACLSTKPQLQVAAIPADWTPKACALLEGLLEIPCKGLANYLTVTLTPSNPVLHTARLYGLFHAYQAGKGWEAPIGFYDQWDNFSSQILLQCDQELQNICKAFDGMDLSGVVSLKKHYEADSVQAMTDKIKSIRSFQGIPAPMVLRDGKWIPDLNSRYFEEDFPYGLCILKGFALLAQLQTPCMDKLLLWYQALKRVAFFENGQFTGEGLKHLPLPQNNGISTKKDIYAFYC